MKSLHLLRVLVSFHSLVFAVSQANYQSYIRGTPNSPESNRELQEDEDVPTRKIPPVVSKNALKLNKRPNILDRLNTSRPSSFSSTPSDSPSATPTKEPSVNPTWQPTSSQSPTLNTAFSSDKITVGVFYYPWHADDFHRDEGYLRQFLNPQQMPALGEYDDRSAATISQHLKWSRQANIQLWITSWWGPNRRVDNTTQLILEHRELKNHKIALHYETFGRIRKEEGFSLQRVQGDMIHICQKYLKHPNYYTIDGKPVIVVYLTRVLSREGVLNDFVSIVRSTAMQACGVDVYIVGDQVFGSASEKLKNPSFVYEPFELLDAVLNYDVYGSMGGTGGILPEQQVRNYYETEQRLWKQVAKERGCSYIPSVAPGYNDLGVRPEAAHPPLSRKLTNGKYLLEASLKYARNLVDPAATNLLVVNSFNEWHEDTQLEPVVTAGNSASLQQLVTVTATPQQLTYGIAYETYGDRYLDMLREGTYFD